MLNKAMLWKPKATLLRRYTFVSTNRGVNYEMVKSNKEVE